MSLSKDTLEAGSLAAKSAAPAAQSRADLDKLRAEAVSLDVPVRVHGSRVTEVVRGVTPHTEPFEEEASTMIVFPHGGVVRMATAVSVGQMLVLTNLRTNQDAICRVVKVRAYSNSQAYVEVEFTHRQVGYWGVRFPADDEESFPAAVPPPQAASEAEKKPVVSSVTVRVEPMPKVPAAPARNESAFALIGSQEDVQPAAAHTELKPRAIPIAPAPRVSASVPVANVAPPPAAKVASPAHSIPPAETEAETIESDTEMEEPRASRTFGTLTGGTGPSAQSLIGSDFGARLDGSASTQASVPRSSHWMWIAACLFFLVAGLAGGAFYFRQHSTEPQGAQESMAPSQPVAPTPPAVVTESSATHPVTQADEGTTPAPATTTIPEHQSRSVTSAPEQPSRLAQNVPSRELRPAAPPPTIPSPAAKNFAPTNARPVARAIEMGRTAAAPSLATAPAVTPNASEALPGVFNSSEAAPLPPPPSQQPLTRVRVGGVIVQPKLVHSVAPNYPSAARTAGISGNVVIVAHVDKTGNVASMKVVSGPATLQAAAMSALRSWKYQPATLDGAAIATDVTVTIKFQQQ